MIEIEDDEETLVPFEPSEPAPKIQVILDANGYVWATHYGTSSGTIVPPEGGKCIDVDADTYDRISAVIADGRFPKVVDGKVDVAPPEVKAAPPPVDLKQLRRDKMWEIGNSSVAGRKRVFKGFPHVNIHDEYRHADLLVMYIRGKIKDEDYYLTRHLKTGEYESVRVGELLDEIEKAFRFKQELRKHDQTYRDKINAIYNDPKKTDEQKAAELEAVPVPAGLGVSTNSTHEKLTLEKK